MRPHERPRFIRRTTRAVGLTCVFEKPFHEAPGRVESVVDALLDERWPWHPRLMRLLCVPGRTTHRKFKQRISKKNARGVVLDAFSAPEISHVELRTSARFELNDAWLDMTTGRDSPWEGRCIYRARAMCRLEGMTPERPIEGWIEVMHELVAAVGALNGILVCEEDELIRQDLYLGTVRLNGVYTHPRWREIERSNSWWLGTKHVLFPRWGTYLRAEHVEAVGGRARIAEVVQPAAMRDVGGLLFVQLTESPAIHDEAKQAAFTELLAPLLPPVR